MKEKGHIARINLRYLAQLYELNRSINSPRVSFAPDTAKGCSDDKI